MKPMSEWLNAPANRRLFRKIREDVHAEARQGKYRLPGRPDEIDPRKVEAEIDARTISLTEVLKADAPPEYLNMSGLESRPDDETRTTRCADCGFGPVPLQAGLPQCARCAAKPQPTRYDARVTWRNVWLAILLASPPAAEDVREDADQ